MKELKTKRLRLLCLELEEMEVYKDSVWKFEDSMGLIHNLPSDQGDELAGDYYGAYLYQKENNPNFDSLWYCIWVFVNMADNKICGGACFKGNPNEKEEVEIGYGIDDEYQNQGYATEAIGELITWAHNQKGVKNVLAETEKENIASHKVLQKLGMTKCSEDGDNYYWKLLSTT